MVLACSLVEGGMAEQIQAEAATEVFLGAEAADVDGILPITRIVEAEEQE